MNKRLLVICPSRGRPGRLKQMLDSLYDTKNGDVDCVVYVANDDPKLEDYKQFDKVVIGERFNIAKVFNYVSCDLKPGYRYYAEANDDHIYHTKGWDDKLIGVIESKGNGVGISYGSNGLNESLPSAVCMSANIINALGYMVNPLFEHTYIDNYFKDLGEKIGRLFKVEDVFIEHRHYLSGKASMDDNYAYVLSKEALDKGKAAYDEWLDKYCVEDVKKVIDECRLYN